MRRKPKPVSSTHYLEGGGYLHIDYRLFPIRKKCDRCGKVKPDCAPDEGDGGLWCLACIEKWEKKHGEHWEDGTPLKV